MSVGPAPTKLDRRVVGRCTGRLASEIARDLGETEHEVRLILRGLEHLGYVKNSRSRWRRTDLGERLLEASC